MSEPIPADTIDLTEASHLLAGQGGERPAYNVVLRWCNPRRGFRPAGPGGPRLVLRTVRVHGQVRTSRGWVEAFDRARKGQLRQTGRNQAGGSENVPENRDVTGGYGIR